MDSTTATTASANNKQEVLLEKEVFMYKLWFNLNQKPGYFHKAKDWDVSNPEESCKLTLVAIGTDLCRIDLENESGVLVGQSLIDCYPGSPGATSAIGRVKDSCRYFTLKIKNRAGEYELVGVGFSTRKESLDLTKALENYFTLPKKPRKDAHVPTIAPVTCPSSEVEPQIKVENADEVEEVIIDKVIPEKSKSDEEVDSSSAAGYPSYLLAHVNPTLYKKPRNFNYFCQLCPSSYSTTKLLKEHVETKHKEEAATILYYCAHNNCKERFLTELTLAKHKKKHTIPPRQSSSSPSSSTSSGSGKSPKRREKSTRRVSSTTDQSNITSNTTDTDEPSERIPFIYRNVANELQCHLCLSKLNSGQKLEKHWAQAHRLQFPIVCRMCSLVFTHKDDWAKHKANLHPRGYACPLCSHYEDLEINLTDHVMTYHNRRFLTSL